MPPIFFEPESLGFTLGSFPSSESTSVCRSVAVPPSEGMLTSPVN